MRKSGHGPQRNRKQSVLVTVAALALGAGLAVAVVSGMFPSSSDSKEPAATQPAAAQAPTPPPQMAAQAMNPLPETPPVAVAAADPIAPRVAEPRLQEPSSRRFVRYETPSDKIVVHEVGEGFEIINSDPKLAGKQVQVAGITESGERVSYTLSVPNPRPATAQNNQ